MKKHDYDKILYRLITIIRRLSDGDVLYKDDLAQEFNVSTKTIQRDFNDRLSSLFQIDKVGNGWKMREGFCLEKSRAMEDILVLDILKNISCGLGISFAKRTESLLNKLTNATPSAFYTRLSFEDMTEISQCFDTLEHAIKHSKIIQFIHKQKYRLVKPYRIVAFDGYWYLLGEEVIDGLVKTFHIARISELQCAQESFVKDQFLQQRLDKAINAWFNPNVEPFEVLLHVSSEVKRYMIDHPLAPTQTIVDENKDGSLILRLEITNELEILSTIQKWMPHITILRPNSLKENIMKHIKEFLEKQI
ncbi:MAG: WYL domain-containing protein [Sulfurospirillaceae bacterium]|nr:WYL domain-containing protein [Sulfurospirillaceae bacterium]